MAQITVATTEIFWEFPRSIDPLITLRSAVQISPQTNYSRACGATMDGHLYFGRSKTAMDAIEDEWVLAIQPIEISAEGVLVLAFFQKLIYFFDRGTGG